MRLRKQKKVVAVTLATAIAVSTISASASAVSYDLANGDVTIGQDTNNGAFSYQGEDKEDNRTYVNKDEQDDGKIIIKGDKDTPTSNTVTVQEDVKKTDNADGSEGRDVDIVIDGVNADTSKTGESTVTVGEGANVDLTVKDSTLTTGGNGIDIGKDLDGTDENKDTKVDLTLEDTTINQTNKNSAGLDVRQGSDVDLTLKGDNVIDGSAAIDSATKEGKKLTDSNINVEGIRVGGEVASDFSGAEKDAHLTIKDDKGKDGSLTAEGGFGGAGIGGGIESTGSNITIRGGTIEAEGGSNAAGIGDGAGRASDDTDDPNPGDLYICGDAEVTAKAGSQMTDAKAPAIGGSYGEVPTENLSDDEHKVTGGRLTRLNADGTVMEGMGYDYTSTPKPQPDDDEDDDDDDVPPPAQENAPEPLPGGMVVGGFFSSRVTIHRLDPALAIESANPMPGSVKAGDAGEVLTPGGVVLIESAAPRSTVTTDISSLREDGVEDIFFRYEDTMTHYSVDKMADAAGEDADVELKQNREDISLRLDGETRDDLSERYLEWVPVQTPEPQERLILTHEHEEVERKTSEELRRELDELLKQEREMGFQFAKKRDDRPSLDWWLEPARTETPRIGLDESLKQMASRFEAIAPEEDKPRLFLLETTVPDGTKYTNLLESDLRSYTDLGDDWDDLPDTQGEIKIWLPEDLGQPKEISISKESLSRSDGIA